MSPAEKPIHAQSNDEALANFDVNPDQGLDRDTVATQRARHGPNQLSQTKRDSALKRLLLQFHQPLIYMLIAAGLVSLALTEYVDAGVIFGVVLINAAVGFLQEDKALKALASLSSSMTTHATVIRDGEQQTLAARDLVPGDVVLLEAGDKVAADMRLLKCRGLQIDEAPLTGESVPVDKQTDPLEAETALANRANLAFAGMLVTHGAGRGVVFATGDHTEIGRISQLLASTDALETPLLRKMNKFSNQLLWAICALAVLTFFVGLWQGKTWVDMLMAAVALAVGAIPEGLPAAMTITLAIGVGRMAKRRAIIRKLPAVETLGSTTVICSDKTGTLTQNRMTVRELFAGDKHYALDGDGLSPAGTFSHQEQAVDPQSHPALLACLQGGLFCNGARLKQDEDGWQLAGDPTEGALLVAAMKADLARDQLLDQSPHLDTVPFDSTRKWMATLHATEQGRTVYIKGALEAILDACNQALNSDGERCDLNREAIEEQAQTMARRGLRVLACARFVPEGQPDEIDEDLPRGTWTFLGLQAMIDPPREAVTNALKACHRAGIRVKMITGDHGETATAIAHKIGLSQDEDYRAVTGTELEKTSDEDLPDLAARTSVFARVSPEQKLRLVKALQTRGEVIAMTGDGVNDAPALRRGDIGVAMGIAGTEVAKDAADMVLTDDNFATIEAAIEEGRGVYDNLVKFITWTLPTNIGMGLVILAAVFTGSLLPILPVQVLWINMTTVILLGLMLAFEPMEPGIMTRPPRRSDAPILDGPLIFRILLVGVLLLAGSFGLFNWALARGADETVARTVAVNVFVMSEIFYLFNCRSLTKSVWKIGFWTNPWLLLCTVAMIGLQLLYTYAPFMNAWFRSGPTSAQDWLWTVAFGLLVYLIIGFEKWLRNRLPEPASQD